MKSLKIGIVQFRPQLFEVDKNLKRALELVKKFSGSLLVFPELAFSGYLFRKKKEIERVCAYNDFVEEKLSNFAKEKNCAIVFGYPERAQKGFYNSSMIIFPNGRKRTYRKTHLFFEEKNFFLPGDTGFFVEEFKGVRVGLAICFDWFFPESFRTLSLMGADVIVHSANLVMPYCQNSNVYASLQNRVYIATANRWGKDENNGKSLEFTGRSQLTDPRGGVIVRAPKTGDILLETEIDLSLSKDKRINAFNDVFMDRRPEFYIF